MHFRELLLPGLVLAASASVASALPTSRPEADLYGTRRIDNTLLPLRMTPAAAIERQLEAGDSTLSQLGRSNNNNRDARHWAEVRNEVARRHAHRKAVTDKENALREPLLARGGGGVRSGGAPSATASAPSSPPCPPTADARKPSFASFLGFLLSKIGLAPAQQQNQVACPPGAAPLPDEGTLRRAAEETRQAEAKFQAAVLKLPLPPPPETFNALPRDISRRPQLVRCLMQSTSGGLHSGVNVDGFRWNSKIFECAAAGGAPEHYLHPNSFLRMRLVSRPSAPPVLELEPLGNGALKTEN